MQETTVRDFNEGITEFSVESFAFFIVPFVHGTRTRFKGGRGGTSGMGEGVKCSFPKAESSEENCA